MKSFFALVFVTFIALSSWRLQLVQLQLIANSPIIAQNNKLSALEEATIVAIQADNLTLLFQADDANNSLDTATQSFADNFIKEQPIPIRYAKWQVAVIKDGVFTCSGSVIGPKWVLTAAQCVDAPAQYFVRGGTRYFRSGGQTRRVDLIILDEDYHAETAAHDLAILRLSRRFEFTENLQAVQLPPIDEPIPEQLFISGWTASSKAHLQQPHSGLHGVIVHLTDSEECARNTAWLRNGNMELPENTFCTRNNFHGQCHGDLGSPIVANGVQYGLFSHDSGCFNRYYSGVNTDLRMNRELIANIIREYSQESKLINF